ncbi:MAG TPA: cytochrome P450 [Solirubrobacteraceae bacterium]|nr:cytochrome P450 [Solirubrobacteraceae bacterium]
MTRPTAFLEGARRRYGPRFTVRLLAQGRIVVIADPQEIKEVLSACPSVLHPGEGAKVIEPVVGSTSVIVLDEDRHLEQRKLMLPPFHGEALQRLTGMIEEFAEREVASWPVGEPIALHPRLQRVALEIILRVVFGVDEGRELDAITEALTVMLDLGQSPAQALMMMPAFAWTPAARRQARRMQEADRILFELVEERRRRGEDRDDVLSMLLAARHDDGTPLSDQELRDELVTALVAGHETTASQLAWAFSILSRMPELTGALGDELSRGAGEELLKSTIQEVMRVRPVIPNAEPRVVKQRCEIGPREYPAGTVLYPSSYLLHHDPAVYPDPYAFVAERFVETPPKTYQWLPFGAGRRRCIGASFAMVEMQAVLRAFLTRYTMRPSLPEPELAVRRGITITPAGQATVVLSNRSTQRVPARLALADAALT